MTAAVVVAVYNGEIFLKTQLHSILGQTRPADEVLLCDDCSSDDSAALIEDFITTHDLGATWKLCRRKQNLGYIRNFYDGIQRTSSDIIFLSDQDDLWAPDKIEKMLAVMEANPQISLLSCRYGIIDEAGNRLKGLLVEKSDDSGKLTQISPHDIMKSLRWPGMTMSLRRDFFNTAKPFCGDLNVIHDVVLALFAAEKGGFYEYQYLGCYHRRHGNNAAGEEHRVCKLLDLERKLAEMVAYNRILERLLQGELPLPIANEGIQQKYQFSSEREKMIRQRRLFPLLKIYRHYGNMPLRSMLLDLWLICFGRYRSLPKGEGNA